jgi:DNA relaxase NicK
MTHDEIIKRLKRIVIEKNEEILKLESDLDYLKTQSKQLAKELYQIRGVRKFDKTFAIIGLVSCAFGVAFLLNYLIGVI